MSRSKFSFPLATVISLVWFLSVTEPSYFMLGGLSAASGQQSSAHFTTRSVEENFQLPAGFQIELYADDDLAHDIYSMTIDPQGRVVVSGAGYIRTLVDSSGDGRADDVIPFAQGPTTGAQGLFFDGSDLLCVGDGGLLRYRDDDGDGRADGDPELLFPIRTGGEHHAHAIRRGPDGAWYLLAGNDAGIGEQHAQGPAPLVTQPEAGGLLRLSPDFSKTEIYADGFRNAYDFDFGPGGEILVYDSDDERDVSLPWYRPTRVFQTLPGSHAGWLSRSWKRPNYFFEMPPVVASLGRGSPTGVVWYQHHHFPEDYQSVLFVADWTFGRVHAVPLQMGSDGAIQTGDVKEFVTGRGQFGFAPTDLEVGPRGDLFISVGGRGTRGGVYRIHWVGVPSVENESPKSTEDTGALAKQLTSPPSAHSLLPDATDPLDQCLRIPQPLSSWGRAIWLPLARQLGPARLQEAICDSSRSDSERSRAIEIMTELHGGLDRATHHQLRDAPPAVRARAAWSLGPSHGHAMKMASDESTGGGASPGELSDFELLERACQDFEAVVLRSALESLLTQAYRVPEPQLRRMLSPALRHDSRWVRQLAARVISHHRERLRLGLLADWEGYPVIARRTLLLGLVERPRQVDSEVFSLAQGLLAEAETADEWIECLRVLQLAAGDVGPGHALPAAFDGYASRLGLNEGESFSLDLSVERRVSRIARRASGAPQPVREWEWKRTATFDGNSTSDPLPAGESETTRQIPDVTSRRHQGQDEHLRQVSRASWRDVSSELGRLAAVLSSASPVWLDLVLSQLSAESHPTDDVHALLVASRLSGDISVRARERIAVTLVQLDRKLEARRLNQDSNWGPRLDQLYAALQSRVPELSQMLLRHPEFGHAAHAWLVRGMSGKEREQGVQRMIQKVGDEMSPDQVVQLVQLIAVTGIGPHRDWLRSLTDHPATQGAAVVALAREPEVDDRGRFVEGLDSWQVGVVRASLRALSGLPTVEDPDAWGALVRLLTKWNRDRQEYEVRDQAARLLERDTGESMGFRTGESGYEPQTEVIGNWVQWLAANYPEVAKRLALDEPPSRSIDVLWAEIPWDDGDESRGEKLFQRKACGLCHSGRTALGPDLKGIAQRFSSRDLLIAIVDPNRDVSSRYLTTVVETHDGKIYRGAVIYEAVDGLTLATSDMQTIRIERDEIARQEISPISLMPTGLMEDVEPRDFADLFSYLRTLVP